MRSLVRRRSESKDVQREHTRMIMTRQGPREIMINKGVGKPKLQTMQRVKKIGKLPILVRPRPIAAGVLKIKPVKEKKEQLWRTIKLNEIFDDNQIELITFMMNKDMWDALLDYFKDDVRPELDRKNILPEYLWYMLRYRLETLIGKMSVPARPTKTDWATLRALVKEQAKAEKVAREDFEKLESELRMLRKEGFI